MSHILAHPRKCILCEELMPTGTRFQFVERKWHGRVDRLPAHVSCSLGHSPRSAQKKIQEVIDSITNDSFVGGRDIVTDSLIQELKAEITRGEQWGMQVLPFARLRNILRKHEVQTPGDTTSQPGEWQIRGGNVDAVQHDGSVNKAAEILDWIHERGGRAERYMGFGDDKVNYIRLDSPRSPNIVGRDWWVVKTADNMFFAVSDVDFHIIYIPRQED